MLLLENLKFHRADEFEFYYVYYLPHKKHLVSEIEEAGGKVICLQRNTSYGILFSLWKTYRTVRLVQPDLIHAHLPVTGFLSRVVGKWLKIPVVYTEHNDLSTYHPFTLRLNKSNYNWNHVVIAVSEDSRMAIKKNLNYSGRLQTILNGVNTELYKRQRVSVEKRTKLLGAAAKGKIVIGTVAVFRKQKQLDKWIQLAHQLFLQNKELFFVVLGDGIENDRLHTLASELGIIDSLFFTGLVNNTRDYYNCMDVYLMTSAYEGLPIALLEAMSMECIPVVTPVGGIRDIITNGANGFFIDADELVESTSTIQSIVTNLYAHQVVASSARQTIVDKFSMIRMVNELKDIYHSVLPEKKTQR